MSSGLGSRFLGAMSSRTQELIGGILGCVGLLHFVVWMSAGGGTSALADLQAGQYSVAATQFGGYASGHPAYVVAFVVGVGVILAARK
ncbi:hypothetical protein [Halarchaeum sp. P4]|uniref:hypothetical protein n=1 Tax=Halarchaeum sp. P4 TaxID=3421639 RepID=UPI003EB9B421